MKESLILTLTVSFALLCAGCCTTKEVTAKASKHYEIDKQGKAVEVEGNWAYDLLVPLTIPYDIVAAPIRGVIWVKKAQHQGDGSGQF